MVIRYTFLHFICRKPTVGGKDLQPVLLDQANFADITNDGLKYCVMDNKGSYKFFEKLFEDAYAIAKTDELPQHSDGEECVEDRKKGKKCAVM